MNRNSGPLLLILLALVSWGAVGAHAQTYTVLDNLGMTNTDPLQPAWMGVFAQGRDGNLYSTTQAGGAFTNSHQYGTVFSLTPSGTMTVLHSFDATNGGIPNSGLTLGTDGNFYGTTTIGGLGWGTIFRITPSGTYTLLHSLNGFSEGTSPNTPPIQGLDGNYYGTAGNGNNSVFGTFYKMTAGGVVTILYTFDSTNRYPRGLVLGTDGNFYGTTIGTSTGLGTVFKMTPLGKITILHKFSGTDGSNPMGQLIQATDGNFYGTTKTGGTGAQGVVYKITPAGVFSVLHNFANDGQGMSPIAGLVQATDGNFYGMAFTNPGVGSGLIYQITSSGVYTILHEYLVKNKDGASPQTAMIQHTGGILFGDTYSGGIGTFCACGVLFSLDMGLGPFVTFLPPHSAGKVGKSIGLLGQGFTGTTDVTFGGISASFAVASDTYMTATVPNLAKTGPIKVITPGGTLTSNKTFRVTPQITTFDPPSGPVGTVVTINGVSLTQTSKVTFGGVKATTFAVVSDSQLTATVPTGAVTGRIAVTTKGGTAISATDFTVTP
ncbi:MAG TPA: choice-of-anchor tandem repeat GloVer-containing protein [Candidatus Sulfotelmatobacter sp.]|nr:choice-of-anchor tandem repeat GloVer-containing protein [Candidatus Sulfotelmatobacter sp.]